jgi:beta-lactamase class D
MSGTRWAVLIALLFASPALAAEPDFARIFEGRDGCFALYDLKAKTMVARFNPDRCAQRTSPCSTFKVPLALMAFDAGVLTDEKSAMKWDGKKTGRDVWDRDQTASTWMRDSVVWFSQRLTPLLGIDKVKGYLASFDFGNQDMSGGITRAWLESSVLISPDEELKFWERFWREELPVSKHAFEMTKKITLVDTSERGWTLHGKTGSGAAGPGGPKQESALWLGWFVGHVSRGDREYLFVCSYTDRVPSRDRRPAGWIARDMAKRILSKMGVY